MKSRSSAAVLDTFVLLVDTGLIVESSSDIRQCSVTGGPFAYVSNGEAYEASSSYRSLSIGQNVNAARWSQDYQSRFHRAARQQKETFRVVYDDTLFGRT